MTKVFLDCLYSSRSISQGIGMFSNADIVCGELLGCFDGPLYLVPMLPSGQPDYGQHFLSGSYCIDVALWQGYCLVLKPYYEDNLTPLDRINHSCKPNSELLPGRGFLVVSNRPILAGEEITIDYRTLDITRGDTPCSCPIEDYLKCRI